MIDLQEEIEKLWQEKHERAINDCDNLTSIFRVNLESFEKMIKVFRSHRGHKEFTKGAYEEIADLLDSNGIKQKNGSKITIPQVAHSLKIARKEAKAATKISGRDKGDSSKLARVKAVGLEAEGVSSEIGVVGGGNI